MKKVITIIGIFGLILVQAQVGINQDAPKATLDVEATTANTTAAVEGLLVSRVSKNKAFLMAGNTTAPLKESTLVYVDNTADYTTTPVAPSVADITEKGYYFWNGSKWVKAVGKDGAEWIYKGDSITLKRSGTGAFKNKFYYNNKGGFWNYDKATSDGFDNDANSFVANNIFESAMANITNKDSKNITAKTTISTRNGAINSKGLSSSELLVSETSPSANPLQITAHSNKVSIQRNNNSNTRGVIGNMSSAVKFDTKDNFYLVGSSAGASTYGGNITGYMTANRSGIYANSPGTTNRILAINAFTTFGPSSGKVNKAYGVNSSANFFGNLSGIKMDQYTSYQASINFRGNNVPINNVTGFKYLGGVPSTATDVDYHYGLYLNNVSNAKNNYAIYTNAGKVRLGDDVSIGTTAAPKKLEVSGKIKAANVIFTGIPTYASDADAATGGLVAGEMYKTAKGELRIKL